MVIAAVTGALGLVLLVLMEARHRTGLPVRDLARDWRHLGWPRAAVLACSNLALRFWAAFDTFPQRPVYRTDREIEAIAPGAAGLKRCWTVVAGEAHAARFSRAQSAHAACQITNDAWDMFMLKRHGEAYDERARRLMPLTCRMLERMGVEMALLSRFAPGTTLPTHTGPSFAVLRYHLCLEGDGRAWIQVGDQRYHWRPGEHVIFDETVPHSAHNPADARPRLVLFADVVRPLAGLAPLLRAAETATAGLHGWNA